MNKPKFDRSKPHVNIAEATKGYKADKKDEALFLIKQEFAKIINDGITEQEFNKAKKKLKARFAESSETVSDISDTIGYYMTVCNDLDLAESYLDDLDKYTIEDANNVAKKYLSIQNSVTTVLLPE